MQFTRQLKTCHTGLPEGHAEGPFFQTKTARQKGCQIDYLIKTKFNILIACEIKFSKNILGLEIVNQMQEKLKNLACPQNHSIMPVLIHANGVQESVLEAGYFAHIINFSDLMS